MKTTKASCESGLETSPVGLSFVQAFFGTNPANQLWYGRTPFLSRRPNSAVPVLPATTIGRSTRLYVYLLATTVRAASRIVVKTQLGAAIFRITFGVNGRTTVPSGLTIS